MRKGHEKHTAISILAYPYSLWQDYGRTLRFLERSMSLVHLMEFMTFPPQPLSPYHLRGPSMALPPVAVLALNLALDGPKSTTSVVSAKDFACRIRHRLGMEAEVPLKTAPWKRKMAGFWGDDMEDLGGVLLLFTVLGPSLAGKMEMMLFMVMRIKCQGTSSYK